MVPRFRYAHLFNKISVWQINRTGLLHYQFPEYSIQITIGENVEILVNRTVIDRRVRTLHFIFNIKPFTETHVDIKYKLSNLPNASGRGTPRFACPKCGSGRYDLYIEGQVIACRVCLRIKPASLIHRSGGPRYMKMIALGHIVPDMHLIKQPQDLRTFIEKYNNSD